MTTTTKHIEWTAEQIKAAGSPAKLTEQVAHTVTLIKPIMAGLPPHVQGAVLGELLAIWLAGHQPICRIQITHDVLKIAIELTEFYDEWKGERR